VDARPTTPRRPIGIYHTTSQVAAGSKPSRGHTGVRPRPGPSETAAPRADNRGSNSKCGPIAVAGGKPPAGWQCRAAIATVYDVLGGQPLSSQRAVKLAPIARFDCGDVGTAGRLPIAEPPA